MKKVYAILSLFLIFIMLWGCAPQAVYINLTQSWQKASETSVYDVSFYYYLIDETKVPSEHQAKIIKDSLDTSARIEIADGELEYKIEQVDAQKNTWKLTSTLSIEYLQKEQLQSILGGEYADFEKSLGLTGVKNLGVTDTMTSTVTFSMATGELFKPLSVSKEFNMPSSEISLEYTFNYQTRTLTYKLNDKEAKTTYKAKKLKSGYDNETLLLLIRSVDKTSFQKGYSAGFSRVYNWTDAVDSGGLMTFNPVNFQVGSDVKTIPIKDEFLAFVNNAVTVDGENRLPVYEVKISKSSSYEMGPALMAWYSEMDVNADSSYATKLMIKTVQNIFDVSTTEKRFSMSYDIVSLSIA
ncbi:MAG TPA: hypothetical protein VIL03_01945 [Clostridia bacterium]